jgi:mono/diheme cytochrome c family protein
VASGIARSLGHLGLWTALAVLAALPANAQKMHWDPVVARGDHIARSACSACHVVAADQEFPPLLVSPAPSFAEVANRPGTSAHSLERFITSTHWDLDKLPMTMPSPMLSKEETAAVARYILSLRK